MSERIYATEYLPSVTSAEQALAIVRVAFGKLGDMARRAGRSVLWDSVSFETEEYEVDDRSFGSPDSRISTRAVTVSVLSIDPAELA